MSRGTVLLTRPEGANEKLATMLRDAGFTVLIRPMISLLAMEASPGAKKLIQDLDLIDRIIFVSKTAVTHGMALLDQYWPQWPSMLTWYAVGTGTAAMLKPFGVEARYPETAGTEGLLALLPTRLDGEHIMIVRGRGGRELMADSLRAAGARVSYLEVYRRQPLLHDDIIHDEIGELPAGAVIVLTSGEILNHFADQAGSRVAGFQAVVPSPRVALEGASRGFAGVTIAAEASDEALYDAVMTIK